MTVYPSTGFPSSTRRRLGRAPGWAARRARWSRRERAAPPPRQRAVAAPRRAGRRRRARGVGRARPPGRDVPRPRPVLGHGEVARAGRAGRAPTPPATAAAAGGGSPAGASNRRPSGKRPVTAVRTNVPPASASRSTAARPNPHGQNASAASWKRRTSSRYRSCACRCCGVRSVPFVQRTGSRVAMPDNVRARGRSASGAPAPRPPGRRRILAPPDGGRYVGARFGTVAGPAAGAGCRP
jgi:hypothetical protein